MMRKSVSALLVGAALVAAGCQKKGEAKAASASPQASMTDDEKAVYALGAAMGRQAEQSVKALNLSAAEQEVLKKGFAASLAGEKPLFELQQYGPALQERARKQAALAAAAEKERWAEFRSAAAAEPGAVKLPSGLVIKTLVPGKGPSPKPTDVVRVHYHGTLPDGTVFDSSVERKEPAEFSLNQVVPCWSEGVGRMKVGEKVKLVCPSEIAYGDTGSPDGRIPPGATLVFEVELLSIKGR